MSSRCKKNPVDPNVDQLSQLPPATQTGANTMGALVNGQAFVNYDDSFYSHSYQCNYIYTNGGYYLTVDGSNHSNSSYIIDIMLNTTQLSVTEGQILKLEDYNTSGKASATYNIIDYAFFPPTYQTTSIVSGQMHITKFDQTKQIISGTFFFNAIKLSTKDTVHVTEGRFDMRYTL
jgi:hypothetical protein